MTPTDVKKLTYRDGDPLRIVPSLVGATISAASIRSTDPGFADEDELFLTFEDGRVVRIKAWGYDAWGLDIDEGS